MSKMILNVAVFGAFFLVVLVLGFFLWQTLFSFDRHGRSDGNGEIAQSELQPGHEKAAGSGTPPHVPNPTEEAIAEYTKWLAIFTLFLVLATVGLFISGERNVEVAGRAAEAAKESAEATKKSVELSDRTAERQLRAYVAIQNGGVLLATVDNAPGFQIKVEIKNSGITPGYRFTTWMKEPKILDIDALPFGEPLPVDERNGSSIIGPGASVWIERFDKFGEGDLEAILNRKKGIFIWGGADYVDAFGKPRHFIFRDMITGQQTGGVWALKPHKVGYDAN